MGTVKGRGTSGGQEVDQDEVCVDRHGDGQGERQARPAGHVHYDDPERVGVDDEGAMDLVRRRKRLIEDEIGELRRKSDDLKKKSERRLVGSQDRSRSQGPRREDCGSRSRREESVRSRREM